jgi:hypothetical protein
MTTPLPPRPRLAARLLGFVLASVFLAGQTALSFHHHDAAPARRSFTQGQTRDEAAVSAPDDCALCAFQIAPGASSTVAAVVAPSASIAALAERPIAVPRDSRPGRISDRSPPAV